MHLSWVSFIGEQCQSNRSNQNGPELSIFPVLLRVVARFSAHADDTTLMIVALKS